MTTATNEIGTSITFDESRNFNTMLVTVCESWESGHIVKSFQSWELARGLRNLMYNGEVYRFYYTNNSIVAELWSGEIVENVFETETNLLVE